MSEEGEQADGHRTFLYSGGQYEQGVSCTVNEAGILTAYSWRQNDGSLWEIREQGSA